MSDVAAWGGLKLEVPPPVLEPIISAINDFLELMVAALDIVLIILDIAKVFIVGLLSPLLAIIDAIIALLESLANDLRKAGLYIHLDKYSGDGKTTMHHLQNLKGGYQAFESRAFNWLIDSGDRKRPDFSTSSGVLGLFVYGSVDFEELMRLIRMIMSFIKLFCKGLPQPLQTPTNLEVELKNTGGAFGLAKVGLTEMFEGEGLPTVAGLSWGHAASPSNPLGIAFPPLPPPCSVIEISTTPEGYMVGCTRQKAGTTDAKKKVNAFVEAPLDIGGGPLRIYGGTQTLRNNSESKQKPEKNGIWFVKSPDDTSPIYLSEWIAAEDAKGAAIGQNQIVIHHGGFMNAVFPNFTYDLLATDLPYGVKKISAGKPVAESERAKEVYVRISSANKGPSTATVNKKLTADDSEGVAGYTIKNINNPSSPLQAKHAPHTSARSPASAPLKVKFPSNSQKIFQQMVRNAACIAYMCRGSIDDDAPLPSGFKPLAKKLAMYIPRGEKAYIKDASLFGSRMKMAVAARRIADDFQNVAGFIPDTVYDALAEAHEKNLNFYMAEQRTINGETVKSFREKVQELKSTGLQFAWGEFKAGSDLYGACKGLKENVLGVHLNYKYFVDDDDAEFTTAVRKRMATGQLYRPAGGSQLTKAQIDSHSSALPVFVGIIGTHEVPDSPKAWAAKMNDGTCQIAYAREMFSTEQLQSALAILQIATNLSGTGQGWIAIRPLETILAPVEDFLEKAIAYMKVVKEGLMAIIQQILDYIRMIEARVIELQQLIRRIQAILAMFADFVISADLHMLVVSGEGTQGLISNFMVAEDKPADGPDAYGTGAVVVAGGLPLMIVDILKAIFAPGDKPGGGASDGSGGEEASGTDMLEEEAEAT